MVNSYPIHPHVSALFKSKKVLLAFYLVERLLPTLQDNASLLFTSTCISGITKALSSNELKSAAQQLVS
jgi:hypothetical protein